MTEPAGARQLKKKDLIERKIILNHWTILGKRLARHFSQYINFKFSVVRALGFLKYLKG